MTNKLKYKKLFTALLFLSVFSYVFVMFGGLAQAQQCVSCYDPDNNILLEKKEIKSISCNIKWFQVPLSLSADGNVNEYGSKIPLPYRPPRPNIPMRAQHNTQATGHGHQCANHESFKTGICTWNSPKKTWGDGMCTTFKQFIECDYDHPGPPKTRYSGWSANKEDGGCRCCPNPQNIPAIYSTAHPQNTLVQWKAYLEQLGCPSK